MNCFFSKSKNLSKSVNFWSQTIFFSEFESNSLFKVSLNFCIYPSPLTNFCKVIALPQRKNAICEAGLGHDFFGINNLL